MNDEIKVGKCGKAFAGVCTCGCLAWAFLAILAVVGLGLLLVLGML